ncbi:UNVERIFIED_CONTAM: hypothetical protein Sangu_1742700 [Sesamum angustifolium]|uniref:Uncharacterized protein n=1 Tax=Sesamum angustifolium TaxID=2727405 RepID=A0AAW2M695_9LAMI
MGIKKDNSGDGGRGEALSEQIHDEDPSSDEKDSPGGVEGEAIVQKEVRGDGRELRIDVDGILLGRRGVEDED